MTVVLPAKEGKCSAPASLSGLHRRSTSYKILDAFHGCTGAQLVTTSLSYNPLLDLAVTFVKQIPGHIWHISDASCSAKVVVVYCTLPTA